MSKDWYKSKRIWTQILTFIFGVIVLIDQIYGTKILDTKLAALIISVLGMFGFYFTKSATSLIN